MDIFDVLTLIGGLCLFLFGMNVMGQALERRAGGKLRSLIGRMTTNKGAGLLTGLGVTSVIQSSSATTVMVVGFVNSGIMTLKQAINVIMGANIGTTVTAWILSLTGIESDNVFMKLLKPTSFTPVLALIGIVLYVFCKNSKKNDTGMILLGFATLMFGMDTMSKAVAGLSDVSAFTNILLLFTNPILGVLAGAILTAIIQSSSASVGILQALAATGKITYGASIPIIMGQNIGTCVTALISSVGANKNAKRAAILHLSFNVIGTGVGLAVFSAIKAIFFPAILKDNVSQMDIAVLHSAFNILCTVLLLPFSGLLEKFVCKIVPDTDEEEFETELDERLLNTPPIALERCRFVAEKMANRAIGAFKDSLKLVSGYSPELAKKIRKDEKRTDHYEDILGTYLVKLSMRKISDEDSNEAAKLLKIIGDFERISDHAVNIVDSVEEMNEKDLTFSDTAEKEIRVLISAVEEIIDLSLSSFLEDDTTSAELVEPLEQIIDELKESLRTNHILRMQQGNCGIEVGFVWSDMLTNLERVSDHCSNIAGCVTDISLGNLNLHQSVKDIKNDEEKYKEHIKYYSEKYSLLNI